MVSALAMGMLIGFLVSTLLYGAFALMNVGLMYKRSEDRTGGTNPSDLGILDSKRWEEAPEEEAPRLDRGPVPSSDRKRAA